MPTATLPPLPRPIAALAGILPLAPLGLLLDHLAAGIASRHPRLFTRLGSHRGKTFLIEPTDLPFAFRLDVAGAAPVVEPVRRGCGTAFDARIAGPLSALLGMIHSSFDGDALFFSGDLVIEGDTEAVLALRNALDDAELDLATELGHAAGPLEPALAALRPHLLPRVERLTGLALSRAT